MQEPVGRDPCDGADSDLCTDDARLYPLEIDPPYQTRWRAQLGEYFSPRAIRSNKDSIRRNVNELTHQRTTDLGGGPSFYDCLVEVSAL